MSDELRTEAADVARALRRRLERERGSSTADLLAAGLARARRTLRAGAPEEPLATAPAVTHGFVPAAPAPAPARRAPSAPAPAAAPAAAASVAPAAPAAPAAAASAPAPAPAKDLASGLAAIRAIVGERPVDDIVLPPFTEALFPSAIGGGRDGLHERSLPVLDAVATEAAACRKCGLCETRTNAVPGVGSARSGIVFVGEAPGADEDERGEPFVGKAGELLTRMIAAMDEKQLIPGVKLDREHVYIVNVLKCRPPENRNPAPDEIAACSPYLLRQLEALQPRVICCLGKFAADLLLQVKNTTIANMRGKTYRWRGAKLIVTYHPAYCLRSPSAKRPVWEDLQRLAQEYLAD
jgi:uracil-DNA glycosylase